MFNDLDFHTILGHRNNHVPFLLNPCNSSGMDGHISPRRSDMRRLIFGCFMWAVVVFSLPSQSVATDYIDLGIEKTDLYSGGSLTSDFVTIKPIALVVTVKNNSSIAIDGFTLVPKIDTYYNGTLLGPASGAFYFQPNYINNAPNTPLSINLHGTFQFRADMSQPKAGHYRCVISFTTGGSIANKDADSTNNQKTIEFDVTQVEPPKPDLAIENFQVTNTGDTFQVSYAVRNIGTDPAQSVFDMKAKIFVVKDPTTIMTREDTFQPHDQPLAPGASVQMGPFVIRDSRTPTAGLNNGTYRVGVYTTQGCNYDTNVSNNRAETNYDFTGGSGQVAPDVIDLGIEKADLYSGGTATSDFVTIKPISLVVTVKNYSSIAIDGFTLIPKIDTYYNGTLLGPASGAFYFQPNYINYASSTPLNINLNGTFQFRADMTQPKAGHYRSVISFTTGGSIANKDSNSANNQKTLEFDVRQVDPPKPDLTVENFRVTKTGDTFQIAYAIKNAGTDPAQSVFDMKAKIFVIKGPTTIMTREDTFKPHDQPIAPGASVQMGPFVIRDSRAPSAGLPDGLYKVGVYTTQGCNYDADIYNNRVEAEYNFWQGSGDYAIDGVPATSRTGVVLPVSYRCAMAQAGLKMGLFSVSETGVNPKLGWQSAPGTSGSLQFNAPDQSGRFLFKLYNPNGQILASSTVFAVVRNVAVPGTTSGGVVAAPVNTGVSSAIKPGLLGKDALAAAGDSPSGDCGRNLALKGLNGYAVADCVKGYDEVVILVDENPDSTRNMRFKGERTRVRYAWPESGGTCPGDFQVKQAYKNAAKRTGCKILADRPRYTAFELTESGRKTYVSVESQNNGRNVVFIAIEPASLPVAPKASALERLPRTATVLKKRSSAKADAMNEGDEIQPPDENCYKDLVIGGIDGYSVTGCTQSHGEAVILLDENPEALKNVKCEGRVTTVRYEWPEEAGDPPGEAQVKRLYKNEAKTHGAKTLADRRNYTAFELTVLGKKSCITVETFNGGRKIVYTSVETETLK
jgi:hypothetical protein